MVKTNITIEEKNLLREYLKTSPLVLVRLKCCALLARDKGLTVKDVADMVARSQKTISGWLKEWNEERMSSIFTGHQANENASKLTKEQKDEIKKALVEPPSVYGIPKDFWDVPALKKYTQTKFSVVYESVQSYHFLLSFSNLSFKCPDTFDRRRNETQITERMAEIREEIKPFRQNPEWEIFASDEVRMELEAFTRRAWLRRGERTIVKVERKREAQSYLGLLNQKTFRCHLYELSWQNQEEVIKALAQFLKRYPKKKICIIWDNASFHKGTEIRAALGNGNLLERIHLIGMPPYTPDHNPIEHVWNTAKKSMANIQSENFEKMKETFAGYVRGRKFKYKI